MNVSLKLQPADESVRPKTYLLNCGSTLIGRAENCSLRLSCSTISRWHCIVDVSPDGAYITDLHSRNGTRVNDRRAVRQPLRHDDVLRIGQLSFIISVESKKELPCPTQDHALAVAPSWDQTAQTQPESAPEQASAIAPSLTSPVSEHSRALSASKRKPPQPLRNADDLAQNAASYEQALINCIDQLQQLSQKVENLEDRLNAIVPPDQADPPQQTPKKAFERHDAMMYIARAAVYEKARQQSAPSSSASP